MKRIKWIARLLLVAIVGTLGAAAFSESHYRVQATRAISAPPPQVYAEVADLKNWEHWSPWKAKDPTVVNKYDGPPSGPGSTMSWTSEKSGSGKATITDTFPNVHVRYQLVFIDFDSKSDGEILLTDQGGATQVTWVMEGERSFVERLFWLVLRAEKAILNDFNYGLELLEKTVKTKQPA